MRGSSGGNKNFLLVKSRTTKITKHIVPSAKSMIPPVVSCDVVSEERVELPDNNSVMPPRVSKTDTTGPIEDGYLR